MKINKPGVFILWMFIFCAIRFSSVFAYQEYEECTVGVASGRATTDGRPMIWKTRDARARNNEVCFNDSGTYKYVAVFSAGGTKSPWMGLNEKGFAILNSLSTDLAVKGDRSAFGQNGTFMHRALSTCADVAEFQRLLDRTNITGRKTGANYPVLDAKGSAAIFETGNTVYWKFDATDSVVAPDGYILRTNFTQNGGGNGGIERFRRTTELMKNFYQTDKISFKEILRTQMRDFVDAEGNSIILPFQQRWVPSTPVGYVQCNKSICRPSSVAAAVIQGVLPGEDPLLSTMWVMLGQPAASITVPYWPVGKTPELADGEKTAPLCDVSLKIKSLLFDFKEMKDGKRTAKSKMFINTYRIKNNNGNGLWKLTFPVEDKIVAEAMKKKEKWRKKGVNIAEMLKSENRLASEAYKGLKKSYEKLTEISNDKRN